jgi:broad specificity phosphatase PhoE
VPDTPRPRVVLVRHGETAWTKSGQHTSRTDIPLTDAGRRQAGQLASRLPRTFALVLTSPLQRARETCRLAGFAEQAVVSDDVTEWDYGSYEGLTTAEIRAVRPGWSLWRDGAPGGETAEDVGPRADRVIARVRDVDGDVAVFSHGHFLRVLGARWIGLPPSAGELFALRPATISVLGWEREISVIDRWNDDGQQMVLGPIPEHHRT